MLVLVLAVLPSLHIFPALEVYDEKRLFQVVLLLVVGLLFVGTRLIASLQDGESDNNARPYVMNSVATWGIAFFMLLGIVSIWLNGGWYYGLQELSLYILLFAFMLFTAHIYVYTSDSITASDGIAYNRPFEKGMALLLLVWADCMPSNSLWAMACTGLWITRCGRGQGIKIRILVLQICGFSTRCRCGRCHCLLFGPFR